MRKNFWFGLCVGVFIAAVIAWCWAMPVDQKNTVLQKETAYERVMRTNTLRCGYFSWYPAFLKDPKTGKLGGIFYDYMEILASNLHLKLEWVEEVGLGDYPAALESGRIDAMCSSVFVTAERSRANSFITPAYYLPLHAYARVDDERFDHFSIAAFNKPDYKLAILEGGVTSIIRRQFFPETKPYELPQLTNPAELFTTLAMGKADFLLYDLFTFQEFNRHNPGQLKRVTAQPIKVFPLAVAVGKNDYALWQMLSTATMDMHLAGTMDQILQKYETHPGTLIRMTMPYE
jgi:ABC-type amino acid transport substrate-binding protein